MNECFILDGISSKSMGIEIVRLGENDTMPIFGGQEVIEQQLLNYDYSLFVRTRKENLRFELIFSLLDQSFKPTINYALGNIFAKSVPVSFEIGEDRSKIMYVTPMTSQIEIVRFGGLKGYFSIPFQATTPYWLTAPNLNKIETILKTDEEFIVDNKTNIQDRFGKYDYSPYVRFKIIEDNTTPNIFDFKITHISNNKEIIFKDCVENEIIELEGKRTTSSIRENLFKDWNRNEFLLHEGKNIFKTNHQCEVYLNPLYPIFQ